MMTAKPFQNYIDGEWVNGSSFVENINPSDLSDVVGEYTQADEEQVTQAIDCAHQAFGEWQFSSIQERANILERVGLELEARKEELGELLAREEGKTRAEGIGEVVRASQVFKFYSGESLRNPGETLPSLRPGLSVEVTREPVGVIGIITPWNYPIAIPAWKIAPALCYGNAVVFKPAGLVPASAWALTDILVRAGVPKGVFNLVMGRGSIVGEAIVNSDKVAGVTFTGSTATGRSIAERCAARGAKVQTEMGGKNPLVVLDDADIDVAVDCAIQGAYYSTGQRCTASERIIVTEKIHDHFVEEMIRQVSLLRVGHALDPETIIGPVVDKQQLEADLSYFDIGKKEGAELIVGGEVLERETDGFYLSPALFINSHGDMRINREEIFGPVASVSKVKNYEEALAEANDVIYGLSSGIVTRSLRYACDFKRRSQAGMVMVNVATAGVDYHAPFGGRKGSSYGSREQGRAASEFFTVSKTAYICP